MKRGKWDKHIWEASDIQFLKDNYMKMTNQQLADGLGIKLTTCRTKLYQLGLQRMQMEFWTEEQVQFLKDNYKELGDVELAEILQEVTPKEKGWTKNHIAKKRKYLSLKRTMSEHHQILLRNRDQKRHSTVKRSWKKRRENNLWERQNAFAISLGYESIAEAMIDIGKEQFKIRFYENFELA